MKTYRRHRCDAKHRTTRTFMWCAIPNACWIVGDGPYALIAWCRVPSVTLWRTLAEAEASKTDIDRHSCGGMCNGRHEIVQVVL